MANIDRTRRIREHLWRLAIRTVGIVKQSRLGRSLLIGYNPVTTQKSEADLLVFISSVMDDELTPARDSTVMAIRRMSLGRPWAFEYTPASSEAASDAYLRKVEEADFVIWLVGSKTSQPVVNEIHRCLASQGRLLVFRLPSDERDEQTDTLLREAGQVVKWKDVTDLTMLAKEINLALTDEVIRALRDPLGTARNQSLLRSRERSFSDCIVSLTALGVAKDVANDLVYDENVGHDINCLEPGLHVITAPQGSGKTFAAHRLFQKRIQHALQDASQAFPILLKAADLKDNLWETVENRCRGCVDPQVQPLLVIVDAIDETGYHEATSLLRQMEVYANANPRAILIATTRPLPNLDHLGNNIQIPVLKEEEVVGLIGKVSGAPPEKIVPRLWERSLRDSSSFPLFAAMIGVWLRENSEVRGLSGRKLVEHLGQVALAESAGNGEETDRLLQELATKAISNGTAVRLDEVTLRLAKQRQLTDSRLVQQTNDRVDFTLPIFREWYAARALLEEAIAVEDIDLDSDRWTIPLSVAVHSGNLTKAQEMMSHLASINPSVAAAVLKEDEMAWYLGGEKPSLPATAVGTGEELRRAMGTWSSGLGTIFKVIGPVNPEGSLTTLGVELSGDSLGYSWYCGSDQLAPVIEFTDDYNPLRRDATWELARDWPIQSFGAIPPTELWNWVNTKSDLVRTLTETLQHYGLSHEIPDAVSELAWEFASGFDSRGSLYQGPIAISNVLEFIHSLPRNPNMTVRTVGKDYAWHEIEAIKNQLSYLLEAGQHDIFDPWPAADLPLSSSSIWSRYSDQRLLERTSAIYTAALRIYQALVERWFTSFADRLRLYRLMPVRLEGSLSRLHRGAIEFPWLHWIPVIIADSECSQVAFVIETEHTGHENSDDYFAEQKDAFTRLRLGDTERLVLFRTSSALKESEPRPATKLAYGWIHDELRGLGWVN